MMNIIRGPEEVKRAWCQEQRSSAAGRKKPGVFGQSSSSVKDVSRKSQALTRDRRKRRNASSGPRTRAPRSPVQIRAGPPKFPIYFHVKGPINPVLVGKRRPSSRAFSGVECLELRS